MRSAHANEEDLKICHICFYKTSSNQNLKTHIEAKHEKVRNFECPQCDLKFYAKATMVHHIKGKYLTNSSDDFTNLFPRIFLSLSCWKRKENSYWFKQVFFLSQFGNQKRNHNKYSLKNFVDSEFMIGITIRWIR